MKNNDNQYYIYIRSTKERVPVTKEEFDNYYRDISVFRRKQQRHGRCVCPENKRLNCDMDCATCPFRRAGDGLSLDYTTTDEDGTEIRWADNLEDSSPLIEDIVADGIQMTALFKSLNELMPQALEIGRMRQLGMSDTAISAEIGIPRKTFTDRLKGAKDILKSEFPDIF